MSILRTNCILCNGELSKIFDTRMPVYMGIQLNEFYEFDEMIFCKCDTCGEVQLNNLIDLEVLYQLNHNNTIVGDTWIEHFKQLSKFIQPHVEGKDVLEISDPSAKIANLCDGFENWYIIEPNPDDIDVNNVTFLKNFFENVNDYTEIDVIVHSHTLEHMYDPIQFLSKCRNHLKDDGIMIFSIPNMNFLLHSECSPANVLHFEHTYYIDDVIVKYLSEVTGFEIIDRYEYKNHSLFYKFKKFNINENAILKLNNISDKFNLNFNKHKELVENICKKIDDFDHVFIFGCHVSTQFYLSIGLSESKVNGVLDNSENKVGNKLYGTDLITYDPTYIKNLENCLVICSHVGVYSEEISRQLQDINPNVVIM